MTLLQSLEEMVRAMRAQASANFPDVQGPLLGHIINGNDLLREAAAMIETLSRAPSDEEFLDTTLGMFADLCNKHGVSLALTSDKNLDAALMEFCAALRRVSRPAPLAARKEG